MDELNSNIISQKIAKVKTKIYSESFCLIYLTPSHLEKEQNFFSGKTVGNDIRESIPKSKPQ